MGISYTPIFLKSCYNVFKPKNENLPSGYDRGIQMGENILTYKESTKYLGIILDDKMTWKAHIAETTRKITKYAGIFLESKIHDAKKMSHYPVYNSFTFPQNKLWHRSPWEYNLGNLETFKSSTKQNFKDSAIQAP